MTKLHRKVPFICNQGSPLIASRKVGRNDPCPCGSGKKYKACCNAPVKYYLTGKALERKSLTVMEKQKRKEEGNAND